MKIAQINTPLFQSQFLLSLKLFKSKLERNERVKLHLFTVLLTLANFLDVLAVGLLALFASIVSTSTQANGLSSSNGLLERLALQIRPVTDSTVLMAILVLILMLSKSYFSIIIYNFFFKFLATINRRLTKSTLITISKDLPYFRQFYSLEEIGFALKTGSIAITVVCLSSLVSLISDVILVSLILALLLFIQPVITLICILFFLISIFPIRRYISKKQQFLGQSESENTVSMLEKSFDYFQINDSLTDVESKEYFVGEILSNQVIAVKSFSQRLFLQMAPKYILEMSLILFSSLIFFSSSILGANILKSSTYTIIFLIAGLRLSPNLLRIQASISAIQIELPIGKGFLSLLTHCEPAKRLSVVVSNSVNFKAQIKISDLEVISANKSSFILEPLSLNLEGPGAWAITGPSGSGKSTFVRSILGIEPKAKGLIEFTTDGGSSDTLGFNSTGELNCVTSYIPQDIALVHGTLKENIALGQPIESIDNNRVISLLNFVKLHSYADLVGIETRVRGTHDATRLSGGEVQRIGLARALYNSPKFLFMDEATTGLDKLLQNEFSQLFDLLSDELLVLYVTHETDSIPAHHGILNIQGGKLLKVRNFKPF